MGKGWIVGAVVMLAWVAVSAYFIMSGQPIDLPPEAQAYLPHFVIVLGAGFIFIRFRKVTADPALDRANLMAVASGVFLVILLGFALATWGNDSNQGRNWLLGAIAWSPIAILLIVRYRNLLKPR